MLHFRLQVFRSAATHLNFTKAAEELFITQPAVTKHIKELECNLRITLFEREKNGISLTRAGQVLLQYTEEIAEREKKLAYELSLLRDSFLGSLQLGASTTIGQYIIPSILASFHKTFPDIEISLTNKNTQEIETDVIRKEIDLGIIEGNSRKKELKYTPFRKDEIVLITHTDNTLALKDTITLEELKTLPLVLREVGSGSLEVIADRLYHHGIKLKDLHILMHLGSTESIKNFLRNACCLGFVSIHAVSKEIVNGEFKVIDVDGLEITRDLHFIYPQGEQPGLVKQFMTFSMDTITKSNRLNCTK